MPSRHEVRAVSVAWQYYIITLLVYFGVNLMAGWSLNLQYGVTGIMNFSFIIFQALGAYIAGVTTLGPSSATGFQTYILGWSLPWPLSLLAAGVAGALLALLIGAMALRPIGRDFQAMVMLIVSVMALIFVGAENWLFNGSQGLAAIPKPLTSGLGTDLISYGWYYVGLTAVVCAAGYLVIHRITSAPYGRRLRALRENPISAGALGINVRKETLIVFMVGGALASVSGAVLVGFVGAWSPAAWGVFETFLLFAALTVGGMGNNAGVTLGVAVVLTGILQSVQYLPSLGQGDLIGAIQLMAVALLLMAFLWFRPQGLIPERRRILSRRVPGASAVLATAGGAPVPVRTSPAPVPTAPVPVQKAPPPPHKAESTEVLRVSGIARAFGGLKAVDDVSFGINQGQITGIIGPNGAGKSTLLNLLAGVERPDAGTVYHDGERISGLPSHRIAARGIIRTFQLASEFARLTVLENMLAASRHQRGAHLASAMVGKRYWRRQENSELERAWDLLARFELTRLADDWAGDLSGGQKRLLELARALMASPQVLLLDEPLAGVAPLMRAEVEGHLMSLRDDGLTVVMVEHELGAVERCTDSVIVMAMGRVLASGTMSELRQSPEVVDAYLVA
jgi:ABC-type branched-subunit amino acid transport system ATPase component/ABC-type branched-subunit amino acid transport system permease subunit